MARKDNYDELLRYVVGLGFTVKPGTPGWIPAAQKRMCDVANAIWEAGERTFPLWVHYTRKDKLFTVRQKREDGLLHFTGEVDARRM